MGNARKSGLQFCLLFCLAAAPCLVAEREPLSDGTIASEQKISMTSGGFPGVLQDEDRFGSAVALLGDLDSDGHVEVAVGAPATDDAGDKRGAVWIVSLNSAGGATSATKISATQGGFEGTLDDGDRFGFALAGLGDLDGDGTYELAVGAPWDDDGGIDKGAVWIISLEPAGTVASEHKISNDSGGFGGTLPNHSQLGRSLAVLSDLDGNGVRELAVGAPHDPGEGTARGAVFVLFVDSAATVVAQTKIDFPFFPDGSRFGFALTGLDDLDGDGISDLAIGIPGTDFGGAEDVGHVWLARLSANGMVSGRDGGIDLEPRLQPGEEFGTALANLGDLNGDGDTDLAVGAPLSDDGGPDRGAVWSFFLNPRDETNNRGTKISALEGGFGGVLDDDDRFGRSIARLGDLNGDGVPEIAVGAPNDDDGGTDRGALWVLFPTVAPDLVADETVFSTENDWESMDGIGDVDGNGVPDLLAGYPLEDDGGDARGAVRILLLDESGGIQDQRTISSTQGGFVGPLSDGVRFGWTVAALGDLNGDGTGDIAVGQVAAVWILRLAPDSTVLGEQRISSTEGWIGDPPSGFFINPIELATIGDVNGDGVPDLAVAASSAGLIVFLTARRDPRSLRPGGAPERKVPRRGAARSGARLRGDRDVSGPVRFLTEVCDDATRSFLVPCPRRATEPEGCSRDSPEGSRAHPRGRGADVDRRPTSHVARGPHC